MDVDHLYARMREDITMKQLVRQCAYAMSIFTLKGGFELRNYPSSPIDM